MDEVAELLRRAARQGDTGGNSEDVERLRNHFLAELLDQPWFTLRRGDGVSLAAKAVDRVVLALRSRMESAGAGTAWRKEIDTVRKSWLNAIFFLPEMVEQLYSPQPAADAALVNHGVSVHCEFIQKTARSAVYRHANSLASVRFDTEGFAEELWGLVMDEVVRCMTDTAARVWKAEGGAPRTLPPVGVRGHGRNVSLRVALAGPVPLAAVYHSGSRLAVWDYERLEVMRQWDARGFEERNADPPVKLVFSADGSLIAAEYPGNRVAVLNLRGEADDIRWYGENGRAEFLRDFGAGEPAGESGFPVDRLEAGTASGARLPFGEYVKGVYDWCVRPGGAAAATASEIQRTMPEWMKRAGFERAARHIAKKRLVDLIRKNINASRAADSGARVLARQIDGDEDVLDRIGVHDSHGWADDRDFQTILRIMEPKTVRHKRRDISCGELLKLKAEGLTNAEIGEAVGVPRGTVDYLWNQCKEIVVKTFPLLGG